jgi:hypothetical protein
MYDNCKPCLTIREFFKIVYRNTIKAYRNIKADLAVYKKINQVSCVISEQAESMKKQGRSIKDYSSEILLFPNPIVEKYDPEKAKAVQEEIEQALRISNLNHDNQIRIDK